MELDHEAEKEPILADGVSKFDDEDLERCSSRPRSKMFSIHIVLLTIQLIFIILNIYTFSTIRSDNCLSFDRGSEQSKSGSIVGPYSPALDAVEYEVRLIDTHQSGSKFTGKPRLEVDQAWSDLLSATMITLSEDEMRQMNKTSGLLKDGNGYAGYLEAYHQLHCVKRMYQFRHPEYYKDIADGDKFALPHWDHCVEVLRQGVMCHADLTVNTIFSKGEHEVEVNTAWPRKCKNWNRIQEWAEERTAPVDRNHQADFVRPVGEVGSIGPVDLL